MSAKPYNKVLAAQLLLSQQALLADYRGKPYAEHRQTKEWAILVAVVVADGYPAGEALFPSITG